MARADEATVREAIAAAVAAQPAMSAMPAYERKAVLMHVRAAWARPCPWFTSPALMATPREAPG